MSMELHQWKITRSFNSRRKEHIRNTKQHAKGSNVAEHAWTFDHVIDFNTFTITDKGNHHTRKTLAKTVEADNNSFSHQRKYNIPLNEH